MLSAILITGVSAFGANLHYYIVGQIVETFKSVHIIEESACNVGFHCIHICIEFEVIV